MKIEKQLPIPQYVDSKINKARAIIDQKQDALSSLGQDAIENKNYCLYVFTWAGEKFLATLGYVIDRFKKIFSCFFTPNVTLAEIDEEELALAPTEEPVNSQPVPQAPNSPKSSKTSQSFLSPGSKKEREAELQHTVLEFDLRQKKKLDELLEVLDRNDALWLKNNTEKIRERAKSLKLCNPFETLKHAFKGKNHLTSKDNLDHLRNIPNKWFGGSRVWEACIKVFAAGLENYQMEHVQEFDKEFQSFITSLGHDYASIKPLLQNSTVEPWQKWNLVFKKLVFKK